MTEEIWKKIEGYEDYLVSDKGRVFALPKTDAIGRSHDGMILRNKHHQNGYVFVALAKGGKLRQYRVHRLVAEAFVPNPYQCDEVNHIDGDKNNNCAENLEWCTRAENNKHAVKFGLRDLKYMQSCARKKNMRPVAQIENGNVIAVYPSMTDAGIAVGTNGGCISQAVKTGCKSGGYEWRYA